MSASLSRVIYVIALAVAACGDGGSPVSQSVSQVTDATGDAAGGPGRHGDASGVMPAGTDLALVELTDSGTALALHVESTEDLAAALGQVESLTWVVRFWRDAQGQEPQYVLGVTTVGPGTPGAGPMRVFLCEAPGLSSCPEILDSLRKAGGQVMVEGNALKVVLPRVLLASIGPSFQWAAELTGNTTASAADQWWDFAPDWARGAELKRSLGQGGDGAVSLGPAAEEQARREQGAPHPAPESRVWHRPGE